MRSFMSINRNITFMHISRFILVSKSTSFTFFIWIFAYIITFFCRRFVYIHTFFHCKMMCGCRLITCLYDIQQTSYERRLHHNHVAPSVPIWTEFTSHQGHLYSRQILRQIGACGLRRLEDSVSTSTALLRHVYCAALYIIYIWGKIENHLNYTYANARDFSTLHR